MDNNIFEIAKINRTDEGKPYSLRIVDRECRSMEIYMKWDGCIDLYTHCNGSTVDDERTDDVDYIHICEVKEFIARLEEVVKIAEENFSKEDFENGWN